MKTNNNVFERHAKVLSALSNPTRLEIIQLLRGQSLNVSQIVQMTSERQAKISQHLRVLRQVGVLDSEHIGKESYYHIKHKNFTRAIDLMRDVLNTKLPDNKEPTVTDPICQMSLTPSTSAYVCSYDGIRHYFCGKGCMHKFAQSHKLSL